MNDFHQGPQRRDCLPVPPASDHAIRNLWPVFTEDVQARLIAGAQAYGDESFRRAPADLIEEIRQEVRDVAGWSFILDCRLKNILERIQAIDALSLHETAQPDIQGQDR
jgi:hypothetical protein